MDEELKAQIDQAAVLLIRAKHVVALTGAGVSVESGIRPYRGPGGLWTERGEPPMDGYQRFMADPEKWWEERLNASNGGEFAKRLSAEPNPSHYALAELEALGVLKFLITQNTDNLHRKAGSKNLAEIHGNGTLLRCTSCLARFDRSTFQIKEVPPKCPSCGGVVKSDGVMFGEPIPRDVLARCFREVSQCDCMLVAGTSAVVYPAASFPQSVRDEGNPVIEVNPYDTARSGMCDIVLRGQSGVILPMLVNAVKGKLGQQHKPS